MQTLGDDVASIHTTPCNPFIFCRFPSVRLFLSPIAFKYFVVALLVSLNSPAKREAPIEVIMTDISLDCKMSVGVEKTSTLKQVPGQYLVLQFSRFNQTALFLLKHVGQVIFEGLNPI